MDPVNSAPTYGEGSAGKSTINPSGDGCSGNGPPAGSSGTASYAAGESGGALTPIASGGIDVGTSSCGATNSGSGAFTSSAPMFARQFRDCYARGIYLGPCAVVVNPRWTSGTCTDPCGLVWFDTSTNLTNTFGSGGEIYPFKHILNLNDVGGAGPCPAQTSGYPGGPNVSLCADDVFEEGGPAPYASHPNSTCGNDPALLLFASTAGVEPPFGNQTGDGVCFSISYYTQQTIVLSKASSQSATCVQGISTTALPIDSKPNGALVVCEAEAVFLFP